MPVIESYNFLYRALINSDIIKFVNPEFCHSISLAMSSHLRKKPSCRTSPRKPSNTSNQEVLAQISPKSDTSTREVVTARCVVCQRHVACRELNKSKFCQKCSELDVQRAPSKHFILKASCCGNWYRLNRFADLPSTTVCKRCPTFRRGRPRSAQV